MNDPAGSGPGAGHVVSQAVTLRSMLMDLIEV